LAAAIERSVGAAANGGVAVELVPGRRGAFEVTRDGALVYSKLASGRFPTSDDEVIVAL
jgi:selT/selW/selH-like putative selenoprotein